MSLIVIYVSRPTMTANLYISETNLRIAIQIWSDMRDFVSFYFFLQVQRIAPDSTPRILPRHPLGGNPARAPGGLKIKPARYPVDIQNLARKKQSWYLAALHIAKVHIA